jgi:peptidoglycan/xylan/chitin deacetylase (PgdA/CDA1 family)
MHAAWSYLKARVGNRLARHLRVAPAKLNNSGPMVSFTFDDAPISAAKVGADMLEQYDARGTFYIAGGLVDAWSGNWTGVSAEDIAGLHRRGHEIACHTFSHARVTDLSATAMAAELRKNRCWRSTHRSRSRTSPIPTAPGRCCGRASSAPHSIRLAAFFPVSTVVWRICNICAPCR